MNTKRETYIPLVPQKPSTRTVGDLKPGDIFILRGESLYVTNLRMRFLGGYVFLSPPYATVNICSLDGPVAKEEVHLFEGEVVLRQILED